MIFLLEASIQYWGADKKLSSLPVWSSDKLTEEEVGFGFVEMPNDDEACAIDELNGLSSDVQ
jgi:hypothetical protein